MGLLFTTSLCLSSTSYTLFHTPCQLFVYTPPRSPTPCDSARFYRATAWTVFPRFVFTFLKLGVTNHLGTIAKFQELMHFAVECLKKRKVMRWYSSPISLTCKGLFIQHFKSSLQSSPGFNDGCTLLKVLFSCLYHGAS